MKIGCHVLTLNDGPYIWYALKSSYPAVDHIVVIEGAITHDEYGNLFHQVPATKEGLSLDNTSEEVRRFIKEEDVDHKIDYRQIGFVHSWEDLRNRAHSLLPEDTDIELIQDGDCLFKPYHILRAKEVMENYPSVFEIAEFCWSFIWDFRTVMRTGQGWKDYWRWCCFRYNPTMHFTKERTLEFRDGSTGGQIKIDWEDYVRGPKDEGKYIVYDPDLLQVFHFGNVQLKDRMEIQLMRKFFSPQKMAYNKMNLPDRKRETLMAWLKFYHKYYTMVPDTEVETFEKFNGIYPLEGLIETHPYFNKQREWFGHDDLDGDPSSPFYGKGWWD